MTSQRDVEAVLRGDRPYDALGEREQTIVRAAWDQRVAERITALDFAGEFTAAGDSWSEAEDDRRVTVRGGSPTPTPDSA